MDRKRETEGVAHVRCTVEVDLELDRATGAVASTVHLPATDAYVSIDDAEISAADWLRLLDWSWGELSFASHLPRTTDFSVVGYWSDSGSGAVVPVKCDTGRHAMAKAAVGSSSGGREFVPVAAVFGGEIVALADIVLPARSGGRPAR